MFSTDLELVEVFTESLLWVQSSDEGTKIDQEIKSFDASPVVCVHDGLHFEIWLIILYTLLHVKFLSV